jgi:hypothetical protein
MTDHSTDQPTALADTTAIEDANLWPHDFTVTRLVTYPEPEYSGWHCHMFGSHGHGVTWRPLKGKEPNWWWRWMQWVCFGHRWVRVSK